MCGLSGKLLIAVGLLHTVYGAWMGYSLFSRIGAAAFSTEAGRQVVTALGRQLVFWFLISGFFMLLLGHFCMWFERVHSRPVPQLVGLELLMLSVIGIVVMPASGFWLVLAVAVYMIVSSRRRSIRV